MDDGRRPGVLSIGIVAPLDAVGVGLLLPGPRRAAAFLVRAVPAVVAVRVRVFAVGGGVALAAAREQEVDCERGEEDSGSDADADADAYFGA